MKLSPADARLPTRRSFVKSLESARLNLLIGATGRGRPLFPGGIGCGFRLGRTGPARRGRTPLPRADLGYGASGDRRPVSGGPVALGDGAEGGRGAALMATEELREVARVMEAEFGGDG